MGKPLRAKSCCRAAALIAAVLSGGALPLLALPGFGWFSSALKLEPVVSLNLPPAGMTVTPEGSYIISLHQFAHADERAVRISPKGEMELFPDNRGGKGIEGGAIRLDAVQGLECDADGIVWMVDNGRRSESTPKLVAWDTEDEKPAKIIHLPEPATVEGSFIADLALDPEEPFAYVTDPAGGATAALIVVDLRSNLARRVLQGHYSVVPVPDSPIVADGKPVQARRADGAAVMPQTGVVPVACDRKGEWVYFGPANGRTVYRIRAEHLRDSGLTPIELASRVDGFGEKPACVSMTIDDKGNLYFGDLAQNAISVLDAKEQKLRVYFSDPLISWPGGLCFGPDDKLYFFASQLHRSPFLNRGKNEVQPPIQLLRLKAIAGGQVGR